MAITVRVDADRLTRSRFAVSPIIEISNSLEVLLHPDRAPYALRWIQRTRRRIVPGRVAVLFALTEHSSWYVPDFLAPLPDRYQPSLDDELAAVEATPDAEVRRQLGLAFRIGPPPPQARRRARPGTDARAPLPRMVTEVLDAGGAAELAARAARELRYYWDTAVGESWPDLRKTLDQDVRRHAALASQRGFGQILGSLHPELDWDGAQVTLSRPFVDVIEATPGLILAPSVFLPQPAVWQGTATSAPRSGGSVMIGYPAHGRAQVWAVPEPPGDSREVLGGRRAALLADLTTPRSTTELASRHGLSAATVSYHLGRLRQVGLVTSRKQGSSVLYAQTRRASALLTALGVDEADTKNVS